VLVIDMIANAQRALIAEEASLEVGATPSRVREIRAGRATARRAMQNLGTEPLPLFADANGAPLWPPGLCGSLAHSATQIAVIAARLRHFRSVGVDIEDGRDLGTATSDVAGLAELEGLVSSGIASNTATAARLAFSFKEAIFKCQAPVTGFQTLEFRDVVLQSTPAGPILALPGPGLPGDVARIIARTINLCLQIQEVRMTIAALPAL
jgi:4'-phosphopantetheinyl transferase EntD